jgi:flagellar FliL protein
MSSSDAIGEKVDADAKPGSLGKTVVELLIVTVIAAAAGAGLTILEPPMIAAPAAGSGAGASPTATGGGPACAGATINIVDLPPVVTNIGSPPDTWVRMEASIVFDPKTTPHPEIMAAEIATDEMAYLRTIALTQMQGPIGLQNIRQDLADRADVRSGGKVTEFILRTLVVQ